MHWSKAGETIPVAVVAAAGASLVALVTVHMMSAWPQSCLLVVAVGPALLCLYLALKYPEVALAVMLTAHLFKGEATLDMPAYADPTLWTGGLIVVGISYRLLKGGFRLPRMPLRVILPYGALAALMLISLLYTVPEAQAYGLDKAMRFVTITALATFAPLFVFPSLAAFKRFLFALVAITSVATVGTLIFGTDSSRASSFGANPINYARSAGVAVLIVLFFCFRSSNRPSKTVLWVLVALVNTVGLVASGSRGPALALVAAVLLTMLPRIRFRARKAVVTRSVAVAAALVIGLGGALQIAPTYFETLQHRFQIISARGGSQRTTLYEIAIDAMGSAPVLGLGAGSFSTLGPLAAAKKYPHDLILEVGSELGIVGLLFLLTLVAIPFCDLVKLKRVAAVELQPTVLTVLALFIFMFLNALLSADINGNRLFFVWIGTVYSIHRFQSGTHSAYQAVSCPAGDTS